MMTLAIRYNLRTVVLLVGSICAVLAVVRLWMRQATAICVHPVPRGCQVFFGNRDLIAGKLSVDEAFRLNIPMNEKNRHDRYRNSPLGICFLDVDGVDAGFLHLRAAQGAKETFKTTSILVDGIPVNVVLLTQATLSESGKVSMTPCPTFSSNPSAGSVRMMGVAGQGNLRMYTMQVEVPGVVQKEADALNGGVQLAVVAISLTDLEQTDRYWDIKATGSTIEFELPIRTANEQFKFTFWFKGKDGRAIEGLRPFAREVLIVE